MTHDRDENNRKSLEFDISGVTDSLIEEMYEDFIDQVFGDNGRLERKTWVKKISKQESWILDSQEIRRKVKGRLDQLRYQPSKIDTQTPASELVVTPKL
jgi:hypothetical protein